MRRSKKFAAVMLSAALLCSAAVPNLGAARVVYAAGDEQAKGTEGKTDEAGKNEAQDNPGKKGTRERLPVWLSLGENQEAPRYQAGDTDQSFVINVENQSAQEIKNIKISVNAGSYWPFTATKLNYTGKIEQLAAAGNEDGNDKSVIKFEGLTVLENVDTGNHQIQLDVYYEDADGNGYKVSNVGLFVSTKAVQQQEPSQDPAQDPTPEPGDGSTDIGGGDFGGGSVSNGDVSGGGSSSASVPRVIVTGFNTEPAEVKAGSDFKLIIHLRNTSKQTAVQNLLFDLQAPTEGSDAATTAPAFLPASGSNSIYLDKIAKDGTQDIAIVLNAKADLVQKPYSVNIGMKYENTDAAQFESSASVSIPVRQDARFEFSEFELSSDTVEVGSELNVMCNLYNMGRTKLYNVKVNFTGEGIKAKEQFLGNVEPGATASIDSMLTGEQETTGDGTVNMVLSYEDEEGKLSTMEKPLTVMVVPPMIQDMGMEVGQEAQTEKKFPVIPFAIGGVVVVAVIAGVVIVKKKKKRKLEQEEEELADEFDRLTEDE